MTWQGATVEPILGSCEFDIYAGTPDFLRGDSNNDGKVDLSDSILTLGCKFLGNACPPCRDASDSNDDGKDDISDPIYTLSFLFLGGPAPPDPGPRRCGPDLTEDNLPACRQTICNGQ